VTPRLAKAVRRLNPDILHVHGATLNAQLLALTRTARRDAPRIVLHYHGGYPSHSRLGQGVQRRNFRRASRILFSTAAHADPFVREGIAHPSQVVEFMETSSAFQRIDRDEARRETGMAGNPVFLWVGRLDPIKDPLTALRGFERIIEECPDATLYVHFLADTLLADVGAFVSSRPALVDRVHLRGPAPFERMELIYNSADFLLQASLREFSGCAVLEAMSCGVIPIVTDIPSFRAMTGNGTQGVLFTPGEPESIRLSFRRLARRDLPERSKAVRAYFDANLGFPALARQLDRVYRDVIQA
jgi:glycosyltransferase involved in cell wall biosynthesis